MSDTNSIKVASLWEKISSPFGGALLGSLVTFLALLAIFGSANDWYTERLLAEQHSQVTEKSSLQAQALSSSIYRRFSLVNGLEAFVEAEMEAPDFEQKFEVYASRMYSSASGIRNIAIGPQGVMQYVYPTRGNEQVLGYNPLVDARPDVRAEAQRAKYTGKIVLSGPHDLVQGGTGLIVRQAAYRNGAFWGLVNVVVDLQPVLARAGLGTASDGLETALRSETGQIIYGDEKVFAQDPVLQRIILEDNVWELASIPAGGWQASIQQPLEVFQLGGLLFITLITGLAYLSINRQARLSETVRERTREVSEINEQLVLDLNERKRIEAGLRDSEARQASLLEVAPDAIIVINQDQKIILFNRAAEAMFGYPPAEVIGQPLSMLLPENLSGVHIRHVNQFLSSPAVMRNMDERRPIIGRRRDGSEFPAEASISKLVEHDGVRLTAIVRDVSHRKQMEAQLQEREELYRSIFESVNDALFITDMETGEVVDFNPAASRMHGYTDEEFRQLPIAGFVHPDSKPIFARYLQAVSAGEIFRAQAVDVRKDGTAFPIHVLGTTIFYRGKHHILGVVRDITEEMRSFQLLEERVSQRTNELQSILQASHTFTSTLDLDTLLALILDQLRQLIDSPTAAIFVLEHGAQELILISFRRPSSQTPVPQPYRLLSNTLDYQVVVDKKAIIIPNVKADTPEAHLWRSRCDFLYGCQLPDVSSWMAVPMVLQDRSIGMLTFGHPQVDAFNTHHTELAKAFANQAGVAIENARLFQTVQRGADQFRAISELGHRITSILALDELLAQTVRLIQGAFGYYHVHIGLIEGDQIILKEEAGVWEDQLSCPYCPSLQLDLGQDAICSRVAASGQPIKVKDISQEPSYLHPQHATGSGIVVPLKVKGEVIGLLDVESRQVNAFDDSDVAVLQLLANQVAVAIDNARLYEKAQQLAALQERQKLARELHDSVSQALYGLALGARTARTWLDRDPSKAVEPLEYCLTLAEAGLAEMRALIFELRPESLEREGLTAALAKQAAAVQARYNIETKTDFCPEPEAPLPTKEAFYRIALEAMHNTVKHAQASQIQLSLRCEPDRLFVEVVDNGIGFHTNGDFPGHLGLKSMRERIERLGGGLVIESQVGQGTCIQAWAPVYK